MKPEKELVKEDDVVLEIQDGFINIDEILRRVKEKANG